LILEPKWCLGGADTHTAAAEEVWTCYSILVELGEVEDDQLTVNTEPDYLNVQQAIVFSRDFSRVF